MIGDMSFLSILWYFLIFLLIAGYFVLDGFDLGIGVLLPFVCKEEKEKAIARRAIGPVWDGNEVWLLTAGGALFAAFPDAYATTFSGFYLAIMLVLFGLIVRAVSFEFHNGDPKWRKLWDFAFFVGSLLPAYLLGVAVGNLMEGIPMDAAGNYTGVPLLGLLSPFTMLCGLLSLIMCAAAGASWLALKAPLGSLLQRKAAFYRPRIQLGALLVFVLTTAMLYTSSPDIMEPVTPELKLPCWIVMFLACLGLLYGVFMERSANPKVDLLVFLTQSLSAVFLVALVALHMFPTLVQALPGSEGAAITIMSAGASDLSLTCMTVILCIGLPLVLVYHIIIYRTFRGRIEE